MNIKQTLYFVIIFSLSPFFLISQSSDLVLTGIIDFTVPSGGSNGKAIHLTATDTISDLSIYGIGVANNGGGTDGQEYTFDPISILPGEDILVARSISAMTSYFDTCFIEFEHVLQANGNISQNGDDAIELFMSGSVVETFGYINASGLGQCWQYTDSWAYKDTSSLDTCAGGNWIFGGVDCTDGSTTSYSSNCPYPLCPLPPNAGCNDPFALNYDPLATFNDGSCLYSGCLDPNALNYCSSCNVNDSLSCIYPACNILDLNESFESNNLNTNGWLTFSGSESNVILSSSNSLSGNVSLEFSGGNPNWSGWTSPFSESSAFINNTHVSSSMICLDFSTASATINLNILVYPTGNSSTYPYSWYRLKVNDTVVADLYGNTAYTRQYSNSTPLTGNVGILSSPTNLIYDLSSYSGDSSVSISIESSCKWTNDIVLVDNFNVFNVNPCSYFNLSASLTHPSCYQSSDGIAVVSISNDSLYSDTYSYLWSDGQTNDSAINLSSGSYSCIVTGNTYGCIDTLNIILEDPDSISVQSIIVDASSLSSNDGSVDLSVIGGTICLPDSSYNFLWSTGDTTEDVTGLSAGSISCTVTDCNGCIYIWNGTILVNIVSGCTDPLAYNFNPIANTDDGSCLYSGCLDPNALNYDALATINDSSCVYPPALSLQGIIDFTVPSGGNDGKAIHLTATDSIADLSIYGIGVANNGGGTDGLEYVFPLMSVNPGEDILLCRDSSVMASYFDGCFSEFDYVITASGSISQNGDDAIELFMDSLVVETFGDINVDGTGECWDYLDSWAYKSFSGDSSCLSGQWIFGGVNCTDGSTTTYNSLCPYPLCPPPVSPGCTDSTALNYDPLASSDDGSCIYPVYGCIDSLATNYNFSATIDDGSCFYFEVNLSIQGIIDFSVPSGGSNGKAIHFLATDSISDLSLYGIGVANNGGGTDSIEYVFPDISVNSGENILLCRDSSAMASYFSSCFNEFEHIIIGSSAISQNGDDAIELYKIFSSSTLPISHTVNSGNYYYTPSSLTINSGDTVVWLNNGGYHNINFINSSINGLSFGNPESFITSPTSGPVLGSHIFNISGSYSYDCSVGSHAANGMVGSLTVQNNITYSSIVVETFGDINVDGSGQPWEYLDSWAYKINSGTSGAFNLNNWNFGAVNCTDGSTTIYDASCLYPICPPPTISGCTDSLALNYDPLATIDDGTCNYTSQPMVNLFFSEYAEGNSNNKYFELYNPTSDTVDLSLYAYPNVSNAPTTPGVYEYWNEFNVGAVILPNDVYVVAHPSSDPIILAQADETFTYLSNGDDGFGLAFGDQTSYQVIDWLGDWNGDPGSGWEVAGLLNATQNHTLVRKCDVTSGDTSWTNAAGTDSLNSQWIVYPNETWVFLGYHTSPCNNGILGCTDSLALNYDSLATINDGSCLYPIYGCTDSLALNYNPLATNDDGTCNYILQPMVNLFFSEYAEGSSNNKYFEVYNPTTDTIDLSQYAYPNVSNAPTTPGVYEYWNEFDVGAVILPNDVYVVAHPSADPIILAQSNETYSYLSNGDDGFGLVFGDQTSYQVIDWLGDWNGDPGSGWDVAGISNATKDHTLVRKCDVTSGDTSWTNSSGTDSLNSQWLVYPQNTWTYLGFHVSPCNFVYGCTDSLALNYDSSATVDDGSCIFPVYGCTDSTALNYDSLATLDDGSCIYCFYGCTDPVALNYDSLATCDDGSCIAPIYGCTDSSAINFYPGANTDDGSCIYTGCTDSSSCNYDSLATIDDGSCYGVPGCIDPLALNYDSLACIDDGSCTYMSCTTNPTPSGLANDWVTDTKAGITWDNMNDSACMVLKYFIRYREFGAPSWVTKSAGVGNGLCNFGLNTTNKILQNLTSGTTYEYKMKAFYCGGTESNYSAPSQFTTAGDCPAIANLTATTFNGNQSKVTFTWDTTGAYVFARVALRVDTAGANWQTAGGFGVYYPTFTVNKFGLQSGESYRAQGRAFCDSNITSYRSWWTSPIFWTQPGAIRMSGGSIITNLDVYPNPTDDIFNISFVSEEIQTLSIRVINIVGEVVYTESLEHFVGEYTKQISIGDNSKGIYFLEITDNSGTINKKIILQ